MKRFLALILCMALCVSLFGAVQAAPSNSKEKAEGPTISGYLSKGPTRDNEEEDPLMWAYYPDYGILEITGTGAMPDFGVGSAPWDEIREDIYGVYIDDNVSYIGEYSFRSCSYLMAAYLGEGLTEIGPNAFEYCYRLEEVQFPSRLKTIGDHAFYSSGLRNVVIPDHVENLGRGAFESCSQLETVYIGAGIKSMGMDVFDGCNALREAEFAEGITELPAGTFHNCDVLQKVSLPESLTTIGYDAMSHNDSLQVVRIPNHVEVLPIELFWCTALVSVSLPAGLKEISACAFESVETLNHIFFRGTEDQWKGIQISGSANGALLSATIHYETDEDLTIRYTKDMRKLIHCNICNEDIGESAIYTPFHDVYYDQYYFAPVAWAAEEGITSGTAPFTFDPDKVCTRGQIVTFLWRAKGCPMPTSTECSFIDVSPDAYYYLPVLWAVEQRITTGMSATKFKPDSPCTRAQVATFLWRSEGSPEANTTESPFDDAEKDSYYENAVLWAVEEGITNGTGPATFSPHKECTRGQIVTFLYRANHRS